jgi:glyoxylase-like metal-dependent hydrolase (beta-lactamase superfamily II)
MRTRTAIAWALVALGAGCSGPQPSQAPHAAEPLTLTVYTSGDRGYATTSTLVAGENDAILIDPQFLASDAAKVAAMIRSSGKRLTTIYTTHAHPDHFFGIATLKTEFPDARYVALPDVAKRIETAWPARRRFWYPTYGDELPSATPIVPEPLARPELTLEGATFPITGDVVGDGPGNSYVYIPSLRAVIAGDTVFYRWYMGVPVDPSAWLATLDQIDALDPAVVVPGHKQADAPNDPEATNWMRAYITDFNTFKSQSRSPDELKAKMLEAYPGLAMPERLDQATQAAFATPPPP